MERTVSQDNKTGQNGKGDGERVKDRRRFNKNFDKIFSPKPKDKTQDTDGRSND